MTVILVRKSTVWDINQKVHTVILLNLVECNSDVEGSKCRNKFKTSNNSSKYAVVKTLDVPPHTLSY